MPQKIMNINKKNKSNNKNNKNRKNKQSKVFYYDSKQAVSVPG